MRRKRKVMKRMGCLERSSPSLKEILLKLYHAEKPVEMDHHLYEFGSVEYHIQTSAAHPHSNYLSISTPLLSHGVLSNDLSPYTKEMVKQVCSDAVEIIEPPKQGYQLTLKLNLSRLPHGKDSDKTITRIASVQAVILISQLKEMLQTVNSEDVSTGTHRLIKLVYHPREPFYVIKQPQKITAVFPIRFKEQSDVIIATNFFQELMVLQSTDKWAKAPQCTWSPIPPPELRGESIEDLSTNGGFVTFDIFSRHVKGKRLDKTIWGLINFYAYVKNHVKSTRGFIQRRMQKRLESLVQVLNNTNHEEDQDDKQLKGCMNMSKLIKLPKSKFLKQKLGSFACKIKRICFRIKIRGFKKFRRKWLNLPNFSSHMAYTKLD